MQQLVTSQSLNQLRLVRRHACPGVYHVINCKYDCSCALLLHALAAVQPSIAFRNRAQQIQRTNQDIHTRLAMPCMCTLQSTRLHQQCTPRVCQVRKSTVVLFISFSLSAKLTSCIALPPLHQSHSGPNACDGLRPPRNVQCRTISCKQQTTSRDPLPSAPARLESAQCWQGTGDIPSPEIVVTSLVTKGGCSLAHTAQPLCRHPTTDCVLRVGHRCWVRSDRTWLGPAAEAWSW